MASAGNFDRVLRLYIDNYNAEVTLQNAEERRRKATERAELRNTVLIDIKGVCGQSEASIVQRFMQGCERLVGKNQVFAQLTCEEGGIDIGQLITIQGNTGEAIYYNIIRNTFLYPEGSDDFLLHVGYRSAPFTEGWERYPFRFVVLNETEIPSERIRQQFRNGVKHCILQPLIDLYEKMSANSEKKSSKDKCRQKANQLRKLLEVYPNGVPEDKMEEVAKIAQRKIAFYDILGGEMMAFNEKSTKTLHFTNTRRDHVEEGRITKNMDWISVSREELDRLIKETESGHRLINGTVKHPYMLRTLDACYTTSNEDEEYAKFDKPFKQFGLNAIKHHEVNAFLKSGCLINSAPVRMTEVEDIVEDNIEDDKEMKHIDLSKAYTQDKVCPYYQGIFAMPHHYARGEFDREFLKTHVGIYQFIVLKRVGGNLEKLGLRIGCYDLPSPEILYLMDKGVKLKVIAGCWGSVVDIEYTPEMLEKDKNGLSRYAIWAGKLSQNNLTDTFTFNGDREWASHLKFQLGEDKVAWFEDMKMITVTVPKASHKTRHHMLSFITAYLRINMLETMSAIDGEIHRVICDGIYFKGTIGEVAVKYKDKPVKNSHAFGSGWYRETECSTRLWPLYDSRFDGNCVLAGAGGTGKTTSVFNYGGLLNPLYVVPTHELGKNSGKRYCTVHRYLGIGAEGKPCETYNQKYGVPNVILVDEATMIEASWIERIIAMPHTQVIIAGDIDGKQWYQCRGGYPGNFSKIWNDPSWRYVFYETDYRALDDKLKTLKLALRSEMKRIFGSGAEEIQMRHFIKTRPDLRGDIYTMKEAMEATGGDDIWICSTKKRIAMLKEAGIKSKWGESEEPGYTIHSFQGQTISNRRVFITLDAFEYAMIYTAVSRVREFWQIVFVG
jgi:hypothetical protein